MSKLCGIQAAGGMIGHAGCYREWGHDGMVHYNGGDGFYSRANEAKHRERQKRRRALDFQRQRADEAEHKLVAIRTILENYDPYETDYAFKVVRDIEELKP